MRMRGGLGDLAPLPHARCKLGQRAEEVRSPYRIQPLHLHIVLVVEVHADSDRFDPGVVRVAGVIKVPLVYLCRVKECHISRALTTSLGARRSPWVWWGITAKLLCPAEDQHPVPTAAGAVENDSSRHRHRCVQPTPGSLGCLPAPCMVRGHYGVSPPPPAILPQWKRWPRGDTPCPCIPWGHPQAPVPPWCLHIPVLE